MSPILQQQQNGIFINRSDYCVWPIITKVQNIMQMINLHIEVIVVLLLSFIR